MNDDLLKQKRYWDSEVSTFDSIYSHEKGKFANWLDRTFRWDMYARYEYTLSESDPIQGLSFLDVGCGTGRYALEFARRGAAHVVGIDISDQMIDVCQQRAQSEGVAEQCEWAVADLQQYRPETTFDVCIGIGLFDYIRDAQPIITRMREVVHDRAIMSFPLKWTWRAPVRKVRLGLRNCDVYFYTKSQLDRQIKEAGFARYTLKRVGQLYCVTAFVA
jgi:2-polyprenyl-3-methyl-5-hydroxy-6-metoxy-1,4-benzoquinol methylase